MTKIYVALLTAFALTSCGPSISYIGSTSNPTKNVDVYVEESAIPKEYTVVGKGYVRYFRNAVPESLQTKAISKARQKGADAILVKDYYVPLNNPGITTSVRKDSSGRGVLTIAPQTLSSEVIVLFLKYR